MLHSPIQQTKIIFSILSVVLNLSVFAQKSDTTSKIVVFTNIQQAMSQPSLVNMLHLDNQTEDISNIDFSIFTNLKELTLRYDRLSTLPKGLTKLAQLKILDISANSFTVLPAELSQLCCLEELYLNKENKLDVEKSFSVISQLPRLKRLHMDSMVNIKMPKTLPLNTSIEYLSFRYSNLNKIPSALTSFKNLKILDLEGNKITSLSNKLKRIESLEELSLGLSSNLNLKKAFKVISQTPHLSFLHFDNTQIAEWPADLSQVKNIQSLSLKNDHLLTLPSGISTLPNLKVLDVSGNDFKYLPQELFRLNKLEELYLTNDFNLDTKQSATILNQLPQLKILHIENYGIRNLPQDFTILKKLEKVYLNNDFYLMPQQNKLFKGLNSVDVKNGYIPFNNYDAEGFGIRFGW
jgi:Leucine-rich repeat (LRR) protein